MYKTPVIYLILICLAACTASVKIKDSSAVKKEWKLVWRDEFRYNGLPDSTRWSFDVDGNEWGWGNNELQHYTGFRSENASVDGKYLHIRALKEPWEGKDYTSARLITRYKGDWLYGRIEVRAKLPGGRGIWPAIWMLPSDWGYGDGPPPAEIDIMEHVGFMPDSVFASAHAGSNGLPAGIHKTKGLAVPGCEKKFHTYILEWEQNEYRVYADDIHYFTFTRAESNGTKWRFNKPFYLILNVAVGGSWGGMEGIDDFIFPQEMVVDYVRVYQ